MAREFALRSEVNERDGNEDSHAVFTITPGLGEPPIIFFSIADGMGGYSHGKDVSREVLSQVSQSLFRQLVTERSINSSVYCDGKVGVEDLRRVMLDAIAGADSYVRRMAERSGWGKAGSTVVLAAVIGNSVVAANLGDSPLYHLDAERSQLRKVTTDHTVAAVLLKAGMISPEMARVHEGRGRLEFYVGGSSLPSESPVYDFQLRHGDILLLCTDGVSSALTDSQIETILSDCGGDLEEMAGRLIQSSRDEGETDNQTLIIWQYRGTDKALESAVRSAPEAELRSASGTGTVEPRTDDPFTEYGSLTGPSIATAEGDSLSTDSGSTDRTGVDESPGEGSPSTAEATATSGNSSLVRTEDRPGNDSEAR